MVMAGYSSAGINGAAAPAPVESFNPSVAWPFQFTRPEYAQLAQVRQQVQAQLANLLSQKTQTPLAQVVVRDILPGTDLGNKPDGTNAYDYWNVHSPTANTAATSIANYTLTDQQAIAIYGIADLTPSPTLYKVTVKKGVDTALVVQPEQGYGLGNDGGGLFWLNPWVWWGPREVLDITGYFSADTDQEVILLGFIAE